LLSGRFNERLFFELFFMKLLFPQNIFSSLLVETLPKEIVEGISYTQSSVLYSELETGRYDAVLIPSLEIIKDKELLVSRKMCIAFHSFLCNSYIYFSPEQKELTSLSVMGDISAHDVILGKYLFSEMYSKNVEFNLVTEKNKDVDLQNLMVVGDNNFENMKMLTAMSMSEEVSEMISFPYVNYILVSKSKAVIDELNKLPDLNHIFDEDVERIINCQNISKEAKEYILEQAGALSFVMGENEEHGLVELLRLPYFYGMIDDIVELKLA